MNAVAPVSDFYLTRLLQPLAPILARANVTDIFINRPGEVWIESLGGGIVREEISELGAKELERLARQVAAATHQAISRAHPLMAATLPDGSRMQVVLPPATRGSVSISVRRHLVSDMRLADYERCDAFATASATPNRKRDFELRELLCAGRYSDMLTLAVRQRRNILISGGTASGKTTFLNALLKEIPNDERLILIEDTPELQLVHENAVGLVSVRGEQGEALATADDLLVASMRMRPDRIILGELRGPEAFTFLRSVNTGHPGSMTTVHADSPDRAIEQLALLVLQGGSKLRREDIRDYVTSVIDVYIQLERIEGRHRISAVRLADRIMENSDAA